MELSSCVPARAKLLMQPWLFKVVGTRIICDRESGAPKGYAFVTLQSPAQAQNAMRGMQGYRIMERPITVKIAGQGRGGPPDMGPGPGPGPRGPPMRPGMGGPPGGMAPHGGPPGYGAPPAMGGGPPYQPPHPGGYGSAPRPPYGGPPTPHSQPGMYPPPQGGYPGQPPMPGYPPPQPGAYPPCSSKTGGHRSDGWRVSWGMGSSSRPYPLSSPPAVGGVNPPLPRDEKVQKEYERFMSEMGMA
ncbi:hypothetical protein WJX84_004977 [Apatococcus fuscideae]|uniref:RRM domain-containing protein n=1 Tax=Apatococcus fuscideae TaxID=2026836 RepID=A0AAW1S3P3_9CHLO